MLSIFKVILGIIILCGVPGVIMGLISSYRAGQKPHEDVVRFFKKHTQHIPFRVIWRHIKEYYAYYGMALILVAVAFSE